MYNPWQAHTHTHTPGRQTHPWQAHTPLAGTHPLGRSPSPPAGRHPLSRQADTLPLPPQQADTLSPGRQTPPGRQTSLPRQADTLPHSPVRQTPSPRQADTPWQADIPPLAGRHPWQAKTLLAGRHPLAGRHSLDRHPLPPAGIHPVGRSPLSLLTDSYCSGRTVLECILVNIYIVVFRSYVCDFLTYVPQINMELYIAEFSLNVFTEFPGLSDKRYYIL